MKMSLHELRALISLTTFIALVVLGGVLCL